MHNDQYDIDTLIEAPNDSRRGLTVLTRPDESVTSKIQVFLAELRAIEPHQYYYPSSDIHITILSIISCFPGFSLDSISSTDYIEIVRQSIHGIPPISIQYKGIMLSPAGVLIKGYPQNTALHELRTRLRKNFKNSHLQQSLDKRYTLQTAHSTIMRFTKPLQQKDQLFELVNKYDMHDFGHFKAKNIELVYNDWYQRRENTRKLSDFSLQTTV
ncbi:mutarotase [Echinicola marina]|nr:mutarotase [Echinicola marina]